MRLNLSHVALISFCLLAAVFGPSVFAEERLNMSTSSSFEVVKRGMKLAAFTGDQLKIKLDNFPGYSIDLFYLTIKAAKDSVLLSDAETAVIAAFKECEQNSKHDSLKLKGLLKLAFQKRCNIEAVNAKDKILRWVVGGAFKGETNEFLLLYSWLMPDTAEHEKVGLKIKDEIIESLEGTRFCDGETSPSCDEILKQRLYQEIYQQLRR